MVLGLLVPDPYLFCVDPNPAPFINKQKKNNKLDFWSVHTESNKQNKLEKDLFFVGILEVTDEKSRIRIRKSSVRIQSSILTKM